MATTRLSHRIFFLFLALLFFSTAFAFSFLVIWQEHQNNKSTEDQSKVSTTKLAGTKLTNFTPVAQIPSLQSTDLKEGNGDAITAPTQTITVDYTGAVAATGVIFQSSLDTGQPATFPLNQVITGWTKGLVGMKVGGERRLLIPAAEAYGTTPPAGSGIPTNADLVFDVTLHNIKK